MKYLGIHKLLWLLIVIIYTLFDILITYFMYIIYIIWNFKIPKNWWREYHFQEKYTINKKHKRPLFKVERIIDDDIFITIKRRYNLFNMEEN